MVDSRAKGARGEYAVRDLFRKHTGLGWERVPASGALAYLKSDLYIPHCDNAYAIEVKNYEDPILDIKIFTNKSNNFFNFWVKIQEQAALRDQKPVLVFKHNRSKLFVATEDKPANIERHMYIKWLNCYVMMLEEWLDKETMQWVKA